jgi:HTH-type transcriptional regulator/antitoxin HigA
VLVALVELYEKKAHPIGLPDPIEAIKFRIEQMGMKHKDLIPFFGSRSKVSEVLSRQRPLSIAMIRKLHDGLGIPAEVLLQEHDPKLTKTAAGAEWEHFPLAEMLKRKWLPDFQGTLAEAKKRAENLFGTWAAPLGSDVLEPALLRQHVRAGSESDNHALTAWRIRVSLIAMEQKTPKYQTGTVTQQFVRDLVRLSYLDDGPLLAKEYLLKSGIHFVVEGHLPHTHLDGACIRLPDGSPLVALTLRHDRLDNFWFTLCHELAHIALHFESGDFTAFFDDLDHAETNTCEDDADNWATEALIPSEIWHAADMSRKPSTQKVLDFAASLRINPAIPAGRIRKEKRDYKIFAALVGYKKVRRLVA